MTLVTLRSNDQFNTTIYGFSDRLRGLKGSREIVLINRDEMARLGLSEGQAVSSGLRRSTTGSSGGSMGCGDALRPARRCVAGYYPELNPLVPLELSREEVEDAGLQGHASRDRGVMR